MAAVTAIEKQLTLEESGNDTFQTVTFGNSQRWKKQKELFEAGVVRSIEVENVSLATTFCDAILAFWSSYLLHTNVKTVTNPVIVFLNAAQGRFPFYLLKSLEAKLSGNVLLKDVKPYVVFTDPSAENIDYCKKHPQWEKSCFHNGIAFVQWNGESEIKLPDSVHSNLQTNSKIPVIVIANFFFSQLHQELYYVHYGKNYDVMVNDYPEADEENDNNENNSNNDYVKYSLSEMDGHPSITPTFTTFTKKYLEYFNETFSYIPSGAMQCIDRLKSAFSNELLILAADYGWCSERELRTICNPRILADILQPLPVNFHALSKYVQEKGGTSVCSQQISGGLVTAALYSGRTDDAITFRNRIKPILDVTNAETVALTCQAFTNKENSITADQALSMSRMGVADPVLLFRMLPLLLSDTSDISFEERLHRITLLEQTAGNFYPVCTDEEICFQLGIYAMDLGDWGTAADLFTLEIQLFGDDPSAQYNLALCYRQTGEFEKSLEILETRLSCAVETEEYRKLHESLQSAIKRINDIDWYDNDMLRDGELHLVPICQLHAEAIWYQEYDPSIAVLTRLPEFQSIEDVRIWIDEQIAIENHYLFAVMHNRKGFVGCVALDICKELGHFYFWVGADYQNCGFGTRAAKLILDMAKIKLGIEQIFTSVYMDNVRSVKVMKKIGFRELPFRAEKPDEDLRFWRWGMACESFELYKKLIRVFSSIMSPIGIKSFIVNGVSK
jgi:RimJ/RimL family protein N-acetyltransferase